AETVEPVQQGRQNLSESALFTVSQPGMVAPDIQMAFVHVPFDIIVGQSHPNAVSILPGVVRPNPRGTIKLAGTDPFAPPLPHRDRGDRRAGRRPHQGGPRWLISYCVTDP